MSLRAIFSVLMLALTASTANAALTVTIEDSPGYMPGTSAAGVGIFFSSSTGTDAFFQFEISLDILPLGGGFPPGVTEWDPGTQRGISNRNAAYLTPTGAAITNTGGFGQNFVVSAQRGQGTDFTVPTTPIRMFDVTFDIAPTTALGSYEIRFGSAAAGGSNSTIQTGGGVFLQNITYNSGTLNVVPEPSMLGLSTLGLLAFVGSRRRRV